MFLLFSLSLEIFFLVRKKLREKHIMVNLYPCLFALLANTHMRPSSLDFFFRSNSIWMDGPVNAVNKISNSSCFTLEAHRSSSNEMKQQPSRMNSLLLYLDTMLIFFSCVLLLHLSCLTEERENIYRNT